MCEQDVLLTKVHNVSFIDIHKELERMANNKNEDDAN